jgi:hypothetical protein
MYHQHGYSVPNGSDYLKLPSYYHAPVVRMGMMPQYGTQEPPPTKCAIWDLPCHARKAMAPANIQPLVAPKTDTRVMVAIGVASLGMIGLFAYMLLKD